ncbi:XTP/dITP diphosphatase [Enterovibrio norvegicus]|uniref:dITP/XTP pyrophosphatase n=1 Tax=Enterovibrio norvegicus TaxID=188144 RepID=A0ABV4L8E5_9GAMM|nr:XTP/dITP diphosphatase [Enterovibrio norvegicus]OEF54438.1 non-canonical purine NTP pyrophosphatase, RdgB/HAM1 family [Enterovibrio norvegicus]
MSKVVLATGNVGKVKEMADLLQDFGFDVLAQSEFGISDADETGTTFIENAIIKARHAAKETGLPAIADDSGLEVDYLQGAPGVYSARYAGEGKGDQANIDKLLESMANAPDDQRSARFHCVLVYMRHANDPTPVVCHGVFEGHIAREESGKNGFGYDPVFWVENHNCTLANIEPAVKKQMSHRGQALKKLFAALSERMPSEQAK